MKTIVTSTNRVGRRSCDHLCLSLSVYMISQKRMDLDQFFFCGVGLGPMKSLFDVEAAPYAYDYFLFKVK